MDLLPAYVLPSRQSCEKCLLFKPPTPLVISYSSSNWLTTGLLTQWLSIWGGVVCRLGKTESCGEKSRYLPLLYSEHTINSWCLLHSENQFLLSFLLVLQRIVYFAEFGNSRDASSSSCVPFVFWILIHFFRWSDGLWGQWKRQEKKKSAYLLYCGVVNLSHIIESVAILIPMYLGSILIFSRSFLWANNAHSLFSLLVILP